MFFATHTVVNTCATCGAPLPPSSVFCPRCGADLRLASSQTTAPPAPVPPAPVPPTAAAPPPHVQPVPHAKPWWIVPLVIIGVVVIAFLLLMGMPFGGSEERAQRPAAVPTETIAEGTAPPPAEPAGSATIIDVGDELPPPTTTTAAPIMVPPVTTTTAAPPARQEPIPPVRQQPVPAARQQPVPQPRQQPVPATTTTAVPKRPVPSRPAPREETPSAPASNEISESEAIAKLRGFLVTRNYYNTAAGCVRVSSRGYRNVGYTLDVHDSCESRHLGRWRVDSKTREVFRQSGDGRFLRP